MVREQSDSYSEPLTTAGTGFHCVTEIGSKAFTNRIDKPLEVT